MRLAFQTGVQEPLASRSQPRLPLWCGDAEASGNLRMLGGYPFIVFGIAIMERQPIIASSVILKLVQLDLDRPAIRMHDGTVKIAITHPGPAGRRLADFD